MCGPLPGLVIIAVSKVKSPALPFGAASQYLAEDCGLKDVVVTEKQPAEVLPWTLKLPEINIFLKNPHIYTNGSKDKTLAR